MDKNQKTAQESPILGKQSVSLKKPVYIIESASVVGKKEGEGKGRLESGRGPLSVCR